MTTTIWLPGTIPTVRRHAKGKGARDSIRPPTHKNTHTEAHKRIPRPPAFIALFHWRKGRGREMDHHRSPISRDQRNVLILLDKNEDEDEAEEHAAATE